MSGQTFIRRGVDDQLTTMVKRRGKSCEQESEPHCVDICQPAEADGKNNRNIRGSMDAGESLPLLQ